MSTLVFSHGFGVKADARGMFTQIANNFPDYNAVLFDYNTVLNDGDIEVAPLNEQASILQRQLNEQSDEITLIAHSQGCIVTGLVQLNNVKKVILLAPPVEMSMQRVVDKLMKKPGAEINLEGMSRLPRSDGTITHISKDYIESVNGIDPISLYNRIASSVETVIIRCTNDEVLGLTNVDEVQNAKHVDIMGDHDFNGEARSQLMAVLTEELSLL